MFAARLGKDRDGHQDRPPAEIAVSEYATARPSSRWAGPGSAGRPALDRCPALRAFHALPRQQKYASPLPRVFCK